MMISTKGTYALRVMIDLAQHAENGNISLKEIAERQQLSMKYLESIVSLLTKSDMIRSKRGSTGGYSLAKLPSEYNVAEILKLTEGNLAPVSCLSDCTCSRSDNCLTLPMWQQLENLIYGYLQNITLKDIMDGKIGK